MVFFLFERSEFLIATSQNKIPCACSCVQVLVTYVVFLFSPWEVVSSVCTFLFCNTPPTCNHHLQLRLCWAITMHKSHGQTLDKVAIDLGPKEACTGLTFVCLTRAKRLVVLMVEPMSFDRIGNLGNSSTMKARLQEEVRLVELAQGTSCLLYTSPSPRDRG